MKEKLKNKKTIILIKLIITVLILCGIYVYLVKENEKIIKQQEEYIRKFNFVVDFDYVKSSLLNNDFDYLYIVLDDGITSYSGSRKDKKYTGTVTVNNKKDEYNNLTVLNKKYPFLSIEHILSYFNVEFTKTNRTFLYEKDNLYVKIRVSVDNIIGIEVDDGKVIYQLEISNIKGFEVKGSE